MAIRLLPFRQYAEQDVINLFALQSTQVLNKVTDTGAGDAGIFVKVTNGNLDAGPTTYDNTYRDYLGVDPSSLPYVGKNQYPRVPITVGAAGNNEDPVIGCTLYQTAKLDENEQKLLYYPQKQLETQSVLPGQAVPVLGRGIITVDAGGHDPGTLPNGTANSAALLDLSNVHSGTSCIGSGIKLKAADAGGGGTETNASAHGQLEVSIQDDLGLLTIDSGVFGTILATGSRVVTSGQTADQFAGVPTNADANATKMTGRYAIIKFDTSLLYTHSI